MIATVTLGASVDKLYLVEGGVELGEVMRVAKVSNTAGGKGLNVSRVAALLGEKVTATGFLGGFNGAYVSDMLTASGITPLFAKTKGETRSCINVRDMQTGKHTEFLEPVPPVTDENVAEFLHHFSEAVAAAKVVTISGSMPVGTPPDLYARLITIANRAGKQVILDTSGDALRHGIGAKPAMIKPNADEIAALLGKRPEGQAEVVQAAQTLHGQGIAYVVVSLGREGSVLVCAEGAFKATPPDVPVVNTVGCGDSMVAAFAVGLARGYGAEELLRFATGVSSANAVTIPTGWFEEKDLQPMLDGTMVERLD